MYIKSVALCIKQKTKMKKQSPITFRKPTLPPFFDSAINTAVMTYEVSLTLQNSPSCRILFNNKDSSLKNHSDITLLPM